MMLVHTMTMPIEDITTIFHDVEPIYQDDNGKVCTVMYPSAFKTAYSYIRAVWERKEYSGMFHRKDSLMCSEVPEV